MSMNRPNRVHSLSNHIPPLAEKITEDPITLKTANSNVTCLYQANVANYFRNVTILWTKNLMNHSMSITVDGLDGDHYSCKVDFKPWHFWSRKGYRSFEVEGNEVDVYWDLRSAKFSGSPEPSSDYYVALVSAEEVVLLLGDYKKKAYKRTKCRPALVDAVLFQKKEHVFAKKSFSTRAKIDESHRDHDIVVESLTSGPRDPEMWISIDGIVLIHIRNLIMIATTEAATAAAAVEGAGIFQLKVIQHHQISRSSCMHGKSNKPNPKFLRISDTETQCKTW